MSDNGTTSVLSKEMQSSQRENCPCHRFPEFKCLRMAENSTHLWQLGVSVLKLYLEVRMHAPGFVFAEHSWWMCPQWRWSKESDWTGWPPCFYELIFHPSRILLSHSHLYLNKISISWGLEEIFNYLTCVFLLKSIQESASTRRQRQRLPTTAVSDMCNERMYT